MIVDYLENIDKYKEIIPESAAGFLKLVNKDVLPGHYDLNNLVYVNVDEYQTKALENCKFEAHKKYIDIQMLIDGEEEIDILPVDGLKISEEYNESRDVMFFANPAQKPDVIQLKPYKFVLIYPEEAHRPQMNSGSESKKVKKAVAKILL